MRNQRYKINIDRVNPIEVAPSLTLAADPGTQLRDRTMIRLWALKYGIRPDVLAEAMKALICAEQASARRVWGHRTA